MITHIDRLRIMAIVTLEGTRLEKDGQTVTRAIYIRKGDYFINRGFQFKRRVDQKNHSYHGLPDQRLKRY